MDFLPDLPPRLNAADFLLRAGRDGRACERPLLVSAQGALTRRELDEQASRIGHALRRLGVEAEQRVMLLMGESLAFAACFWGTLKTGAVAVPANPLLTPGELRQFLADSRARALIVDASLWPALATHVKGLRHLRHVIAAGGSLPGLPRLETLAAQEPGALDGELASPDEPAFWLYTSGSTGVPKAAIHLARDVVYAAHIFPKLIGLTAADLTFSAPRMHFAYGMGNSLLFPLATGGTAVIQGEKPTPESVFNTLEQFRPSVFFGGPALFQGMLNTVQERDRTRTRSRLEFLRYCVSAGEALPAPLYEQWRETFGHEILDCVGSTENLTFFLANLPGRSRPGSSGAAVPGFDLRLMDAQGRDVPEGEAGTLWVRGPTTAARYWNRRALTMSVMRGEWLVTGDRFRRRADGRYEFLGRDDDMLKIGGSWVSPLEVEHALLSHPAVAECAVVGRRDESGLGQAMAFVVARGGIQSANLSESLRAHLQGRLAAFKVPRWIEFVDQLPRTSTGKIRRFRLRAS
jgi:benzoate-CoA ligase